MGKLVALISAFYRHATMIRQKNLNTYQKKSEYTEKKILICLPTLKILCSNLYQMSSKRNMNFESRHLNFTKFAENKKAMFFFLLGMFKIHHS